MGMEKVDIGSIPAYEIGNKTAPAVIVLQVCFALYATYTLTFSHKSAHNLLSRNGGV